MKPLKEKTTASENDSLVDRVEKHIIEYIKENALKAEMHCLRNWNLPRP